MIVTATLLDTPYGTFDVTMHADGDTRCLTFSMGNLGVPGTIVRMHSSCLFGEAFGACDCDCGPQLRSVLTEIGTRGAGIVVYLFQEGRGAGLEQKIRGMATQRATGVNSYEAYAALSLPRDMRDYTVAGVALRDMGVSQQITLMSNNPLKREAIESLGFEVTTQTALPYRVDGRAYDYLLMKREHGDHLVDFSKIEFVNGVAE
jgi:GTP cyclohydrolase II